MFKTLNGRPAQIGSRYFEQTMGGYITKFCVGYCPKCHTKVGLNREEMRELGSSIPSTAKLMISRLLHLRIMLPK